MGEHLRILIVEDEAITAMWLEMELRQHGHTVVALADNGAQAVESARAHHPDVAIMDVRLAGPMDGIEASRAIMGFDHCSVIFMSGYPDQLIRIERESVQALGYLSKPVQLPALVRLLARVG